MAMTNLEEAERALRQEKLTLCLYDGQSYWKSTERGVRPLLSLIDAKKDVSAFSAYDKVIGRGAALLYVLLRPKEVACDVLSEKALDVFRSHSLPVRYQTLVPAIMNHRKTGFCPVEEATKDIQDPILALPVIRATLQRLKD